MAKNKKKNTNHITKDLEQVSGGIYTPEGAGERAAKRRSMGSNTPEIGEWVSYGSGPQKTSTAGIRPGDHQTYIPGRNNSNFGNVRG